MDAKDSTAGDEANIDASDVADPADGRKDGNDAGASKSESIPKMSKSNFNSSDV